MVGKSKPNSSKKVLLDADALVALVKDNDSNHKKAMSIYRNQVERQIVFCISPYTIEEATTVVSHKISQEKAVVFLSTMRNKPFHVLELASKKSADNWFKKQITKGTSYFDCYNMALLEEYSNVISHIFSFDKVYEKNGFLLAK